jgi:hypothetical protein
MHNPFYFVLRRIVLILSLFVPPGFLSASNYYWVGGAGDWSDYANHWATTSGGNVFHVQEPTPFDNVYFDANSFSSSGQDVSITATLFTCNNMDWTGVTNHPVFSGSASTGQMEIYGSFTLDTGMTWSHYGMMHFRSASAGNTIKSAGHHLNYILLDGTGGSWTLQDSLRVYSLSVAAGTLYSNNNYINVNDISIAGNAYLGTSVIDFSSTWSVNSATVIDADSTIINTTSGGSFMGGNHIYHDLNLLSAGNFTINHDNQFDKVVALCNFLTINDDNVFDTLYCNGPLQYLFLAAGHTQTIIDTISVNGSCAGLVSFKSTSPGIQAILSKASGNVLMNYMMMQDINATGGANFTANNSIVVSNVTGWTIPAVPVQNLYWVGGTGNWNDPSHWSTTSGGTGGSCLPTFYDNVFFDANSFSNSGDDVTINVPTAYCVNMDWTGALHNPVFNANGSVEIHGSLTLIDSMTVHGGNFNFLSALPSNTITSAGNQLSGVWDNNTGNFSLLDSLNTQSLGINSGTFYSNDHVIRAGSMVLLGNSYLGTSSIYYSSTWSANPSVIVDADSTIIYCTSGGNFTGGSHIYHDVFFNSSSSTIDGNNQFEKVSGPTVMFNINGNNIFDTLYCNNPGQFIILEYGKTQTIVDTIIGGGTCAGLTSLKSSMAGSQATISKASGNVTMDYLLMQDIDGTGGANFTANNSVVVSNVTGWTIPATSGQNLFWVGGAGNWNDPLHWSTTSGGPGGSCLPTMFDNVYFDANSFSTSGDDVDINVSTAYCVDMDWTGALHHPVLSGNGSVEIHGSLTLIDSMTVAGNSANFNFESTTAATITTAGNMLQGVTIAGSGIFTLQDSLHVYNLSVINGTFNSNDQYISVMMFNTSSTTYLGTSVIDLVGNWTAYSFATIDADSTIINAQGIGTFNGGNHIYHYLNFTGNSGGTISDNNHFDKVLGPSGNFTIDDNNNFDTLYFNNPGQTVMLEAGTTQTINNSLQANATGGFPISLTSSSPGLQSTISMPAGDTVCLNYIYMQDQNATGGGIFYAGIYSSNITNNTGWQFTSCVQPISDVWPGDANYDLITDNADILNIGLAYGEIGFLRPGASLTYVAQPCMDWPSQFQNGVNTKHADTDGNGVVNMNDTLAVSLNYGIPHPPRLAAPDSTLINVPDLYFQFPAGPYVAGSWIDVDVNLGTVANPANGIYGLSFSVNYPSAMIVPNTLQVFYNNSWLTSPGNLIHLEKDFYSSSKIDLGFSRINHLDVSGNGIVVKLHFQLAANASGPFMLSFSGITADDAAGNPVQLNPLPGTITVGINDQLPFRDVSLFPNPSYDVVTLDAGSHELKEGSSIELLDLSGRVVMTIPAENKKQVKLDVSDLPEGTYIIRAEFSDGSVMMHKLIRQ